MQINYNADEKEKRLMEREKKVRRKIEELERPKEEVERRKEKAERGDEDVETRPGAVSPPKNCEKRAELFAIK